MENASKALIIAGAILISILIISLGIIIYQQASGVLNDNAMSEADISTFNAKWQQYQGNKVQGATVNAMLQAVVSNNLLQDDDTRRITVSGASINITTGSTNMGTGVATSATYTVTLGYNAQGLVSTITLQKTPTT